jgi:hypothetical protein
MAKCPFPVIPQYLAEVPLNTLRIPGARATRVWTDDPADAPRVAAAIYDDAGSFGALHVFGTRGNLAMTCWDTYTAFRNQLCAFVEMLRTGERPYPLSETIELMAVVIAGLRSRERGGALIELKDVFAELEPPFGRR